MADQAPNKGFSLPVPVQGPAKAESITLPSMVGQNNFPVPDSEGPQPRDYAIAGAILLALLIVFFFVKGSYANYLVGRKVSPNSANAAAWWLFIFLSGLAIASVLAILSPVKFLAPLFMAPLALVSFVAFVLMLVTGRRK